MLKELLAKLREQREKKAQDREEENIREGTNDRYLLWLRKEKQKLEEKLEKERLKGELKYYHKKQLQKNIYGVNDEEQQKKDHIWFGKAKL